jgi:hypothetical protein
MTSSVNESGVFNHRFAPERMRVGKVIVFGVSRINRLAAELALPLRATEDNLLFCVIEKSLRIEPDADLFDDLGAPLSIVLCNSRPGSGLPRCGCVPIGQNVGSKLMCE